MKKSFIKQLGRKLGFEIQRYNLNTSDVAKIEKLFAYHQINLVLDVGANVGQYVNQLRNDVGYSGRIVSFEPLSMAYSQLERVSKKDPLWEIAPRMAIGNENTEITINVAGNSYSSSVLQMLDSHLQAAPESAYLGSETVSLNRLDTVAKNYIIDDSTSIFLKIDVQGFEKQVLEGAVSILPFVKGIQLELSIIPLYQGEILFREMLDFLENIGYEIHAIIPGITDIKTGRTLQMDGIFFKK